MEERIKGYKVQVMADKDWHNYMGGGNNYHIDYVKVAAKTADEARTIAWAQFPDKHIGGAYEVKV